MACHIPMAQMFVAIPATRLDELRALEFLHAELGESNSQSRLAISSALFSTAA